MIELTQKAIDEDSDLLTKKESIAIKAAIKEVITALKSSNTDKITDTTKKLNAQGEPFASKRMDRSINKALTGQSIKKLEF